MSLNLLHGKVCIRCVTGVAGIELAELQICQGVTNLFISRIVMEKTTKEGDSPVGENK